MNGILRASQGSDGGSRNEADLGAVWAPRARCFGSRGAPLAYGRTSQHPWAQLTQTVSSVGIQRQRAVPGIGTRGVPASFRASGEECGG
jgi:hypothetical protein